MMQQPYVPTPPSGEGTWTLLQQRINRALWQWERPLLASRSRVTRFVITTNPGRHDFTDLDEAQSLFAQMEG